MSTAKAMAIGGPMMSHDGYWPSALAWSVLKHAVLFVRCATAFDGFGPQDRRKHLDPDGFCENNAVCHTFGMSSQGSGQLSTSLRLMGLSWPPHVTIHGHPRSGCEIFGKLPLCWGTSPPPAVYSIFILPVGNLFAIASPRMFSNTQHFKQMGPVSSH